MVSVSADGAIGLPCVPQLEQSGLMRRHQAGECTMYTFTTPSSSPVESTCCVSLFMRFMGELSGRYICHGLFLGTMGQALLMSSGPRFKDLAGGSVYSAVEEEAQLSRSTNRSQGTD
jgi:hypothetical protein